MGAGTHLGFRPGSPPEFRQRAQKDPSMPEFDGTTILSVRRGREVAMGGDGQVTLGHTVMKSNAVKVRRMYH